MHDAQNVLPEKIGATEPSEDAHNNLA